MVTSSVRLALGLHGGLLEYRPPESHNQAHHKPESVSCSTFLLHFNFLAKLLVFAQGPHAKRSDESARRGTALQSNFFRERCDVAVGMT